tara:strand:- start:625 stop:1488 length:864 start_codon:yes stop_codon:yes gene_type:complete
MTIIINFINFKNNDFKNKKSKLKMKDFIKKNLNIFYDLKEEIIKKYLNPIENIHLDLILKKNNNDYNLTLFKETYYEKYRKELKNKLKDKIKMSKNNNHKIILESKNNNFSQEINYLYYKLKNHYDDYVPSPYEITNDKDKYIDLLFQNIISICEKINTTDKNELYSIVDSNDYLNYIQKVCNINYKNYISDLFRKINDLSDDNSNTPKIISSEINNKLNFDELCENIQNMLIDNEKIEDVSIKSDDDNINIEMLSENLSIKSDENNIEIDILSDDISDIISEENLN